MSRRPVALSLLLLGSLIAARVAIGEPTAKAKATSKTNGSPPGTTPTPAPAVDLRPRATTPTATPPSMVGTKCESCHASSSWSDVRFPHDKLGFPLRDAHQKVSCKQCHPRNFKDRVPDLCAGCHRDPHALEFGKRCDGCHNERNWQTTFTVDAHRSTNFPLLGRHALIPCSECHAQIRDRSFSRAATACVACHQSDYARTAMGSIDHVAAGFSTECRSCHSTIRWQPASLPQHDDCFRISRGPHGGIRCTSCHSSLPPVTASFTCQSGTAACTSCHEHSCDRTDRRHSSVPGYQCKDRKCYECHRFNSK